MEQETIAEKLVREEKEKEARRKEFTEIHEAYYRIFDTPEGQKVLQDMKTAHHWEGSSFDPRDPYITTFNEGERNVVLRILTLLQTKPGEAVKETNYAR